MISLLVLAGACHRKPKVGTPAPPLFAHTIIVSNPPPALPPPRRLILQPILVPLPLTPYQMAVRDFQDGKYDNAAKTFQDYLDDPDSKSQDGALFYLAMCRTFLGLNNVSPKDIRQARDTYETLLARFPESPYRAPADILRRLLERIGSERLEQARLQKELKERDDQIEQLKDELQKLKDIDMQRRPSRPPP